MFTTTVLIANLLFHNAHAPAPRTEVPAAAASSTAASTQPPLRLRPPALVATPTVLATPASAPRGGLEGRLYAQATFGTPTTASDATATTTVTPAAPTETTATTTTARPTAANVPVTAQERYRRRMVLAHRGLEIATATSLAVTGVLGLVTAINRPTLFGNGRCASGNPIFGEYGCESLGIVHGISGVVSLALYTGVNVLELAAPRPGVVNESRGWRAARSAAQAFHIAGMIAMPVLGMLSAYPSIIGINSEQSREDFSRTARTVHAGLGVLTAGAFLMQTSIDLF